MTEQNSITDQNDKVMAALAHISALLPMVGVLAPIIIWATQKERSKYVSFQALQAVAYQLTMILAYFLAMGCYMMSFFITFFTIPFAGENPDPSTAPFVFLGFLIPFFIFGGIFICGGLFILYGVIGAIFALQGKDFRYFVIGNLVANFLKNE